MPKPKTQKAAHNKISIEATYYLDGLFKEFNKQTHQYHELTKELLSLEGRIELAEKTLCLTRDHLAMAIDRSDSATPRDWGEVFKSVRFVGVRLADACQVVLREHKKLTPEGILSYVNPGTYRFRTGSPLREIHAALLKQNFAKKEGEYWVWVGEPEQQMPLRLRVVKQARKRSDKGNGDAVVA